MSHARGTRPPGSGVPGPEIPGPEIPGIVLAGGASRRMGRDKALVRLGGRPLVAWTTERLAPQCGPLAISRHDGRLDLAAGAALDGVARGLPLLRDPDAGGGAGHAGPLAGLLAGLDWAAAVAPAARFAVTVPVDAPFLPEDFVARLLAARGDAHTDAGTEAGTEAGAGAAAASSGGRRHPVASLWPVDARHALRAALRDEGLRRVGVFLDRLRPALADWPVEPFDPFMNLNAPEDLAAAEAVHARVAR